jgi:DNA-directed RNA polymerase subunit beta
MHKPLPQKRFSKYREPMVAMPDLVAPQVASFRAFIADGLKVLFKEFSPIVDYSKKKFELEFVSFEIGQPKVDEYGAKENKLTYDAPLKAQIRLTNKTAGTKKEQTIFLADFPIMTEHGTFIINGVERVIVPQLARSFGVFFAAGESRNKICFGAKVIPARGAWIEIDSSPTAQFTSKLIAKESFR